MPLVFLGSLGFVSGVEKIADGAGNSAVEESHRCERNVEQAMLAGPLHQLDDSTLGVNVHDDKGTTLTGDAHNFAGGGNAPGV